MIFDYVESLAGALSFDPSLSRRVRREVEDHLWEAVAAGPASDRLEAERRAIANFGDPHVIAAQFATVSVAKQSIRTGAVVIAAIAAVWAVMKARVAWYAAAQWAMSDSMRVVSGVAGPIDRYALWVSVITGIAGWTYISIRPAPAAFEHGYCRQIRRYLFLCKAAAGTLMVSVICDGVLTAFRLLETELSATFLIPILSMIIEIACTGVLIFHIRSAAQRTASAAALLMR